MKYSKMIMLIVMVVVMLFVTGAVGFTTTHLTIINKMQNRELFVKFVQVDNPQNSMTRQLLPATLEKNVEDNISVVSGTYYVWAWARSRKVDQKGHYVYGEYKNCYGFADDQVWDENKAARVIQFSKGNRKLPFADRSCKVLPTEIYKFWDNLTLKDYKYKLNLFSYVY